MKTFIAVVILLLVAVFQMGNTVEEKPCLPEDVKLLCVEMDMVGSGLGWVDAICDGKCDYAIIFSFAGGEPTIDFELTCSQADELFKIYEEYKKEFYKGSSI